MAVFNTFLTSLNLDPVTLGSTIMPPSNALERFVKHRACDECRTRKLACSKDPDGCERCKREKIVCHYSEQKPMGRPRKRQFMETTEPAGILDVDPLDLGPVPYIVDNFEAPYLKSGLSQPPELSDIFQGGDLKDEPPRTMWHFGAGGGDLFGGPLIDFEDGFGSGDHLVPSLEAAPQLSTESNPSLSDSANSPPQITAGPCSCLASMYLSLSSLQQFPSDIVLALRTVRSAAATAATSIWCPRCGSVVLEDPNPPIEAFQNTMLLGTILPIIANGYQRLLKQIDEETEAAETAGQTKTFRFHDYGGLCGRQQTVQEALSCVEKELFFNAVEMPAHQWRTTVRALLRVDIYGHEQGGFKHKGLKDLVTEMETRQKSRHELLDAHVEAGTMEHGPFGQKLCLGERGPKGEKTHGCLQILNMAKVAIDSLVIA